MLECDLVFDHIRRQLGEAAYGTGGTDFTHCRVQRYHSRSPQPVVEHIHRDFVPDIEGSQASVLVMTAVGVHGVNFVNVASGSIAEMYQTIGRAGRGKDGLRQPVFACVFTNGSYFTARHTYDTKMKFLMRPLADRKVCVQKEAFAALDEDSGD